VAASHVVGDVEQGAGFDATPVHTKTLKKRKKLAHRGKLQPSADRTSWTPLHPEGGPCGPRSRGVVVHDCVAEPRRQNEVAEQH
jgi:hypothetical protein